MDVVTRNLDITMIRPSLGDLPSFDFPEGIGVRWYLPGDDRHWVGIHHLADRLNEISEARFRSEFGDNSDELGRRQCYLFDPGGASVGTATAWYDEGFHGEPWGRVHWVAIVPEWQGRGLAKPLMSAVCTRLRELGHTRAYLTTSTARVPAVNLYLSFGFVPEIASDRDAEVWRALAPNLKYPI